MINTQKGMRPIYSPLDRTSSVNTGSIIWPKSELSPCGTNAGNPELAKVFPSRPLGWPIRMQDSLHLARSRFLHNREL